MLEFLMYMSKDFMEESQYREVISKFTVASKSGNIQKWVEMVRNVIGVESYEFIKDCYRKKAEEKKSNNSTLHCIPKEKKKEEVIFQIDIGASRSICLSESETEKSFCSTLHGI
jgi:hypothetical protein